VAQLQQQHHHHQQQQQQQQQLNNNIQGPIFKITFTDVIYSRSLKLVFSWQAFVA
jgi:hypothetical protein